jgi:predicted ATPase
MNSITANPPLTSNCRETASGHTYVWPSDDPRNCSTSTAAARERFSRQKTDCHRADLACLRIAASSGDFPTQAEFPENLMKRFIITGAPGAGKTAIIRQLELDGLSVAEEAATDVIAAAQAQGTVQPWTHPSFIDVIATLQRDRQIRASYQPDEVQFHDRCVVCTAALAVYLGYPYTPLLASELERVKREAIYQHRVFFISNLGFITPTEARRISLEETVRFEKIHEQIYRDFGFELVSVEPGSLVERVRIIEAAIR